MGTGDGAGGAADASGTGSRINWSLLPAVLGPSIAFSVTGVDPLMFTLNLQQISTALGVPHAFVGFLGGAATLIVAAAVLAVGSLGDAHGLKRLLMLGLATNITVNVLAAFSPGYGFLLAMRLLDGFALAALLGLSLALLTVCVPPESRPTAMGVFMATDMLLCGMTPALGGLVIQALGWRWLFLVAPTLAAIAMALTARHVRDTADRRGHKVDVAGVVLFGVALLGLLYGVGEAQNGLTRPLAWLPLALGVLAAVVFVLHERRTPEPALQLGLFRRPAFAVAVLAVLTLDFLSAGFSLVLGQFARDVLALSARRIGMLYLPGTLLIAAAGVLSGRLVTKYTARPVLLTGLVLLAASGLLLAATAAPTMAVWLLVLATWLCNLGILVTSTPASDQVLAAAPPGRSGSVAAVLPVFGMTGYALGPTIYLMLINMLFRKSWLADAASRGLASWRAERAVDAVRRAVTHNPGSGRYELARKASGLALGRDYTTGLRLTMVIVSVLPLILAVVAWFVLPRRPRRRAAPPARPAPPGQGPDSRRR